jgi:lysophospholipase L1-like esterase
MDEAQMTFSKERHRRTRFLNFFISIGAVIVFLGGLELVARVWENNLAQSPQGWELVASRRFRILPSNNPRINAVLHPNMDYCWEGIAVHINSQGLRDAEFDFKKEEDEYRILSLGDSVAFGWEVALEDTYAKQVETWLSSHYQRNIHVINAGILGWDLPIELAYLEETGIRYEPDVIIVELTVENDIYHTTYQIPPASLITWLQTNTSAWGMLSLIFNRVKTSLGLTTSQRPPYPFPLDENDPIWDEYVRFPVEKMARLASQHHADFLLIVFPTDAQVREPGYPTTPQQVVRQLADQHGWLFIDLLPIFRKEYARQLPHVENDNNPLFADRSSHPSPLGHRLAAQAIYEMLNTKGILHPR